MRSIEFAYYNQVFLDNGIIGLYTYLKRDSSLIEGVHFALEREKLWIKYDNLFDLLEALYYKMGEEVYDTYTAKQKLEGGNLFFKLNEEKGIIGVHPFPKMNTYGFTELLTNNAQGVTTKDSNTRKFAQIEKDSPVLASQIRSEFDKRKVKMLSKIYFNEPYTKLTRLDAPVKSYFEEGPNACYLTGQKRKKLVDAQNISPFFSGLSNFNSYLSLTDKKVCWEVMYLSRFAAATCLYKYSDKRRNELNVYFIHAHDLIDLSDMVRERIDTGMRIDTDTLRSAEHEFVSNFRTSNSLGKKTDFVGLNEVLFLILYSLRDQAIKPSDWDNPVLNEWFVDEAEEEIPPALNLPLTMFAIRAESFASTKRPKQFEQIDKFRFIIRMIGHLRNEGVNWRNVIQSLKLLKPSLSQHQNKYELERQFREKILGKILRAQTILADMEGFFNDCYGYLLDGLHDPLKGMGYKNYTDLLQFVTKYELLINSKLMTDKELQERAVKMGAQIGQGILSYGEAPDRKVNARQGRKYIIALRKANQYERFLAELSRIQSRFALNYSREFIDNIDEERFQWARQFIIISALNQINVELSPRKQENNPK